MLTKDKLDTIEVLISKASVDSDITLEESVSVKILKECGYIKKTPIRQPKVNK